MTHDDQLSGIINDSWLKLSQFVQALKASLDRCNFIDFGKEELSMEDSDALDALTSKFSRTADLYTQKLLNGIIRLKRMEASTYVDKMNSCEKTGMIHSASEMILIRDLRNEIAHEYWIDQLREHQSLTIEKVPDSILNIEHTHSYLE